MHAGNRSANIQTFSHAAFFICSNVHLRFLQISSKEHPLLQDLSRIRFLVLDEADRMIEKHCIPQLLQILEAVDDANPGEEDSDQEEDDAHHAHDKKDEEDWQASLPGCVNKPRLRCLPMTCCSMCTR
jgi:hypothetical protein